MSVGGDRPKRASTARARNSPPLDVSIIIPTYRRADRLVGITEALAKQTLGADRFEVVAVDDCSGDDTWQTLTALSATVPFSMRVLQTPVNSGPATARNMGWRSTTAPVVAFLDDDCLPDPEWLAAGVAAMAADESLGVVQGRVRTPEGFDPDSVPAWSHYLVIDRPTPYFEACNILYRREVLEQTDGFDESFGAAWCEDSDLGWKVVEAGWGRGFAADAVVVHAVADRGWRWHFDFGPLERYVVKLARDHPGYRREAFWRPWAFRREDAGFMFAMVGVLLAVRYRPALLLAFPYLWWRRPRRDHKRPLHILTTSVAVDAARATGYLRGSAEHKILVI